VDSFWESMDSFWESMDSFCIVVTNPDSKMICFILWLSNLTSQICEYGFASPILKDSNCGFVLWPELSKIWPVFTNPMNPHESWWILSTIAQNESLQIQAGGFANPDSRIQTLKICIADSIRRAFSKDLYRGFIL
jgi:hypothetical protein